MIATRTLRTDNRESAYSDHSRGTVVLVHGIGGISWMMSSVAAHLRRNGYHVENWGYWSVGHSLPGLCDWFSDRMRDLLERSGESRPLHIVGHSMGSILARAMAARVTLPERSRIVMLSPPNRGSHIATLVGPTLRWLSPAVQDLADLPDSFVNRLPPLTTAEFGIIAAGTDRVVREACTHLDGELDHIVLSAGHTQLVFRSETARQVVHFLDHGRFHRADCLVCVPETAAETVS